MYKHYNTNTNRTVEYDAGVEWIPATRSYSSDREGVVFGSEEIVGAAVAMAGPSARSNGGGGVRKYGGGDARSYDGGCVRSHGVAVQGAKVVVVFEKSHRSKRKKKRLRKGEEERERNDLIFRKDLLRINGKGERFRECTTQKPIMAIITNF